MSCETQHGKPACGNVTGDAVDANSARRAFNRDATSWLVGQAIRYLHAADEEEELGLRRVTELLRQVPGATATMAQAFHDAPGDDHNLRWALLYTLAETEDPAAAGVFYKAAAEPVPAQDRYPKGCETPRDGEVLVRTMAIAGLARTAAKNKEGMDLLYRLLEAQPERALRVETALAILELDPNATERIKSLLPKEMHFVLSIKRVRAEVLAVEAETRAVDVTRQAPEFGSKPTSPRTSNCNCC